MKTTHSYSKGSHVANRTAVPAHTTSAVPHPYRARYPSLYEDFEPYFPRPRSPRKSVKRVVRPVGHMSTDHVWRGASVRIIALLGIVAILVFLMANS